MKIGMRNVKTALSVLICILLFQLFNIGSPFYAAVAAIISMQSSVADSFKTGKYRMLGTFLGALVGLIFALIGRGNPFLISLGIMIIIYISNLLKWNKSISIAGVVFISIMINMNGGSPFAYSFNRLVDTLIGITVAVLINYFISPPINLDKIVNHYHMLLSMLLEDIKGNLARGERINVEELNVKVLSLEQEYNDYKLEFKGKKNSSLESNKVQTTIGLLKNIMDHLKVIDKIEGEQPLTRENCIRAGELLNCSLEAFDETQETAAIVYNYHVGRILDYLEDSPLEKE